MHSFPRLLISGQGSLLDFTEAPDGVCIILYLLYFNGFSMILSFSHVKREPSAQSRQIFTYP